MTGLRAPLINARFAAMINTILETIGNTALLPLEDGIYAKAEFQNPSGSIKARMAEYIIDMAE